MGTIAAPTIGYALLLPFVVVFAAACVGVLAEAVVPRDLRRAAQLLIALVAIVIALVVTIANWRVGGDVVVGVASEASRRISSTKLGLAPNAVPASGNRSGSVTRRPSGRRT